MGTSPSTNSYRQETYRPFDQIVGKGRPPRHKNQHKRSFSPKKRSNTIGCANMLNLKKSNSSYYYQPHWLRMDQNAVEYPACSVGYIQSWFGNGIVVKGTGFLIHKKLVITCARYLYSQQLHKPAKTVQFFPARLKNQGHKYQAARLFYPEQYEKAKNAKEGFFWDFGLMMLDEELEENYGYLGISFDDSQLRKIEPKTIFGYFSGGQEVEMCRFQGCCRLDEGIIYHDFPTIKNIEGGPMLIDAGRDSIVLGMHLNSDNHEGKALKFTTRIYERLNFWLKQRHGFLRIGKITDSQQLRRINMFNWRHLSEVDLSNDEIYVGGNNLGMAMVQLLLQCDWTSILRLNISDNNLGCLGIKQLVKGNWPNLQELNLDNNMLGNQAVEHLKNAKWPRIHTITLSRNTFSAEGVKSLVKCDWKQISKSDLSYNNIGILGAKELSASHKKKMEHLNLEQCNLESQGVYWLTRTDWKRMRWINLAHNHIQDDGAKQLIDSNWYNLEELILDKNGITRQGFKLLLLIQWKYLRKLSVKDNKIDGKGFVLMGNCQWQNLQQLQAENNKVQHSELVIIHSTLDQCLPFLKHASF